MLVAVAIVALLVVAAVVVDIGVAKHSRREAQASADAAALAGAQAMLDGATHDEAATAIRRIAALNFAALADDPGRWLTCTDPDRPTGYVNRTPALTGECVSFDDDTNRVRVVLPDFESPVFFGRVVGRDEYAVGARAEAMWVASTSSAGVCGVCGIDGAELQQAGSSSIVIEDGAMVMSDVLRINSSGAANDPRTMGWYDANHSNNNQYTYLRLASPVPNPFASVSVDYTGVTMHPEMNGQCQHLQPDRMFRQTVNIGGTCTLTTSGVYWFRNGINISGTLTTAPGVRATFVFGCATGTEMYHSPTKCNGQLTGNVNISGTLNLGEPYLAGMSLLWDETASGASVINYNGTITLGGAAYSKNSSPAFGGGSYVMAGLVFGGPGKTATLNGGNLRITSSPGGTGAPTGGAVGLWR